VDVKERVREIVQEVVAAYIARVYPSDQKTSIAVLLTGSTQALEPLLKSLNKLEEHYTTFLLVDKESQSLIQKDRQIKHHFLLDQITTSQIEELIKASELLVVLTPTYNLLSKLTLTMDDDSFSKIAIQYQLAGRSIVIASDSLEPTLSQQLVAPYPVITRIQTYIRQLQQEGITWVPLSQVAPAVEKALTHKRHPIVLARHIEQAEREGRQILRVPPTSLITPMAKDAARDLEIIIDKCEPLKGGTP
jgi:hypothetical protein